MSLGVSVVIPCLNEAETLGRAISEALAGIKQTGLSGEVIVSDNGSTDGSQKIAAGLGARVILVEPRGYGAALHHGILEARYEIVVFADADLSYPFRDLPTLINPILCHQADLVLGTRLEGQIDPGSMPFLNRHLGTPVLSFLIRQLYGLPTSDCNSGMRALRRNHYPELQLICPGMEYATEMLIGAAQAKLRYTEVPIHFRKDARSRAPHLRRWRDGWRHLRFILANGPESVTVIPPLFLGWGLLALAGLLSIDGVHYHTAFLSLAAAEIPVLVALAILLTKVALFQSGKLKSRFIMKLMRWAEQGGLMQGALFALLLLGLQAVIMFYHWRALS